MILCRHVWPFPQRDPADGLDYQRCVNCGHRKLSPIQFGSRRYHTGSGPLFTSELEREVEQERANIRRREAFWL